MSPGEKVLTSDEVDDLIYFARTGDLELLKESIESISQTKAYKPFAILQAAVDIDDDGLGSGSCLLHYPSANGNIEIVRYLISLLPSSTSVPEESSVQKQQPSKDEEAIKFINHQNVSGNTPLHWAGINGHLEVVKTLMKAGANPGLVNSAGRDPVFESDVSSKEGAAECAVEMLKAFADVEKSNGNAEIAAQDIEQVDKVDEQVQTSGGLQEEYTTKEDPVVTEHSSHGPD